MANWMTGLPPNIAQDYMRDPRLLHGQLAYKTGSDTSPVYSPLQGLARALQGGLGGYQMGLARKDAAERGDAYRKTLADALKAEGTGDDRLGKMAEALASNADTADLGMQMSLKDVLAQSQDDRALKRALAVKGLEPPKTRTVKRNGVEVTEQFDPSTRTWTEVGKSTIGLLSPEAAGQKTEIAKASRPITNVSVSSEKKFGEKAGEYYAKDLSERGKGARDALATLQSATEARNLLDSGMITGFGADWVVGLGKALQTAGFKVAEDPIANTEAFAASRAKEVGRIIKLFGAGTGLSDADREYATKAAAGQVTLNEASIRKILDINDRAARNIIKSYNDERSKLKPEELRYFPEVPMPPEPPKTEAPKPPAPKAPKDMTDDEIKKSLGIE